MLLCWKLFYRVKVEGRLLKVRSSHYILLPCGEGFQWHTEHTLEHFFCCLVWSSKCNQDGFDLRHLMCLDTETMSLNSSCIGRPDQEGCHLGRIHCNLRHDRPSAHCMCPQHERCPCLHEGTSVFPSSVMLSWRPLLHQHLGRLRTRQLW